VIAGDTLVDFGLGLEIPVEWLPAGVTRERVAGGLEMLLDLPVEVVSRPTAGRPTEPPWVARSPDNRACSRQGREMRRYVRQPSWVEPVAPRTAPRCGRRAATSMTNVAAVTVWDRDRLVGGVISSAALVGDVTIA